MKPAQLQRLLDEAVAHHQSGRLAEAEKCYRTILQSNPKQPDARHLLGLIAHQCGNPVAAVEQIKAAIALRGNDPFFHNNLGEAHRALRQFPEARAAYERALRLNPRYAAAWNNLGIVLEHLNENEAARGAYERALKLQPDYFESRHNLGVLQDRMGDHAAALESIRAALRLAPQSAQAHSSLGNALQNLGRHDEALQEFDRALALDPKFYPADYNRGTVLQILERFDEAEACYLRVLQQSPDYAEAHNNYGHVLMRMKRVDEAFGRVRRALELKPDMASAWNNLGICYLETADYPAAKAALEKALALQPGDFRAQANLALWYQKQERFKEFVEATQRTLELNPNHVETLINYAGALSELGKPAEALGVIERAVAIDPKRPAAHLGKANVLMALGRTEEALDRYVVAIAQEPVVWRWCGNYLYALNTTDRSTPDEIARIHFQVGARLEASKPPVFVPPAAPLRAFADRRLRVGFVSPDLREHSVARFLEPLWRHHDRERFEFVAYSDLDRPDRATGILKPLVEGWRDIVGQGDATVARQIQADQIDILFDLAGHTRQNRLQLFALRPAPVQASWLGYPNTTGLKCMHYRLTDERADPVGVTDRWHTETLIRLGGPAWCYQAPLDAPEVAERSRASSASIVFCSFNNTVKYSRHTIALWARVLAAVPTSRMLLKGKMLADAAVRDLYLARFAEHGVGAERLEFRGWTKKGEDHFAAYHEADIALDTYPYHGTTTTCEALWMGVPVVTRAGQAHVTRVGVSLLSALGLSEFIAESDADFVAKAAALAANRERLAEIRRTLRARMRESVLMDGPGFARRFEQACLEMAHRSRRA